MNLFARLLVLPLLLTLAFEVSAGTQTEYGVKGGLNFANFKGGDSDGFERNTGFVVGTYLKLDMAPGFAIQPEILYSQKGSSGNLGSRSFITKLEIKMDYIDIPLLLRYTPTSKASARPFFYVGPSFSIVARAEVTSKAPGHTAETVNISNEKFSDIGVVLGGGIELNAGSKSLLFDVRYSRGFSNAFDDVDAFLYAERSSMDDYLMAQENGHALNLRNSLLQVMVGIAF